MIGSCSRCALAPMLLLLGGLVVAGCAPERPRGQPEARLEKRVHAGVDSVRTSYLAAYNAADTAAAVRHFAEDAVYFPPGAEPREGRDEIRSYLADELGEGARLELTPTRAEAVTGAWAVEHGRWAISLSPGGAAKERRVEGSYLAVLRRVSGAWKFVRFADTYDALPTVPVPEAIR